MIDIKEVLLLFDKKCKSSGINNKIQEIQSLAQDWHKQIIKKFLKSKVYSSFKDNFEVLI